MSLPKLIFRGPVLTHSGYGVHARQLLRGIVASRAFDVSVESINWGETAFMLDEDPLTRVIRQLTDKGDAERAGGVKYDVSVQCTIPNEFKKMAAVNIGVTAGIETDRVSPEWLVKVNSEVDLLVVPSVHSANTFANTRYQTRDDKVLGLEKPLVICPEGVDTTVYDTSDVASEASERFKFDTPWNFLFVGLGLDRPMGEDRKNLSSLVKWFCERFAGDRDVGLVLRASIVNGSLLDFKTLTRRVAEIKASTGCGEFPRIHVVHGRLTEHELALLYKHPTVKALVSPTHGEGFGLPLLEAAACGLPVIATDWSGHIDFLTIDGKKRFVPLKFTLTEIPESAGWPGVMEAGSKWASVDGDDLKAKLKKVVLSYDTPKQWAEELATHVAEKFSLVRTAHGFVKTLVDFLNERGPRSREDLVGELRGELEKLAPGKKRLLFTMPMSAGDVYLSTSTVAALRKKFPDHVIMFATEERYKPILSGNPDVDHVIPWRQWMGDVGLCEKLFDEVYTPNLAIQLTTSNWVKKGKGRRLEDEIAAQCGVEPLHKFIRIETVAGLPEKFIVVHPGSGKGQWEARNYLHWQEVVDNIVELCGVKVVQVGAADDPLYKNVVDLRGKTYNELAYIVSKATCFAGIDSFPMHIAAGFDCPTIALFGSSYPGSTGPRAGKLFLLETPSRYSCEKACYKYQCEVDRDHPCINEIKPAYVFETVATILDQSSGMTQEEGAKRFLERTEKYKEHRPKISGYTHVLNPERQGFPYLASIKSMLGFCDEVVVVDGGSDDGSREKIEALGDKVKVIDRKWDWDEPGMDGQQKAFGRAMCSGEFLWQQDADEIVHEDDYEKIRRLVKRFPRDTSLLHLPIVELWGPDGQVRTDRHSWKWRLSRNDFRITHGIHKAARVFDDKTGKTFAKKGMSDGCEYVDIMTNEFIPHRGFYSAELERLRQTDPEEYGRRMNDVFEELPSVFHYSWADIPRKVRNFRDFWDKCWSNLYNDPAPEPRFPDVKTDEDVERKAAELLARGGEHGHAPTFKLRRVLPNVK